MFSEVNYHVFIGLNISRRKIVITLKPDTWITCHTVVMRSGVPCAGSDVKIPSERLTPKQAKRALEAQGAFCGWVWTTDFKTCYRVYHRSARKVSAQPFKSVNGKLSQGSLLPF